ncbi:MAG TPA: D-alanyl-D-alanine carboxypeptidase [Saprospiraceae bacterium]|nr:D-alanyl-D-alanine carboxypeptidase [Saprospiraceae bacterium]
MLNVHPQVGRNQSIVVGKKHRFTWILHLICLAIQINLLVGQTTVDVQTIGDPALTKALKQFDASMTCNSGISIYDVEKGQWMIRSRDEDYFIPASNTKILTLYTALHTLNPQLDAAYAMVRGDTLMIWGMADPGTLYPRIDSTTALLNLIHSSDKTIVFSNQLFQTSRFGKGWAWDDHPRSYQCERNEYPIYGNRIWIDRIGDSVSVTPSYFSTILTIVKDSIAKVDRSEWGDQYMYHYISDTPEEHKTIPITFFKNDLNFIWSEVTGKRITFRDIPLDDQAIPVPGSTRDTMLKIMMRESDNFVAEELLLAAAYRTHGVMTESLLIDSMLRGPMRFILDSIQWYDGSGLSRYNLMTPNTMVRVLNKIYEEKGFKYIEEIFSAGGLNGSLKNWLLKKGSKPFVYAKSGTMRNVLNLSGYLVTRKGKILVFSWMNNQCMDKSKDVKTAMEKFLTFLYEEY